MPTRNISLTEDLDRAVQRRVDSGQYESASEVFRAALHALDQHERLEKAKERWLRKAIAEGDASGIAEDFSLENVLDKAAVELESSADALRGARAKRRVG